MDITVAPYFSLKLQKSGLKMRKNRFESGVEPTYFLVLDRSNLPTYDSYDWTAGCYGTL